MMQKTIIDIIAKNSQCDCKRLEVTIVVGNGQYFAAMEDDDYTSLNAWLHTYDLLSVIHIICAIL